MDPRAHRLVVRIIFHYSKCIINVANICIWMWSINFKLKKKLCRVTQSQKDYNNTSRIKQKESQTAQEKDTIEICP